MRRVVILIALLLGLMALAGMSGATSVEGLISADNAQASNMDPGSGPGGCTYPGQVIRPYPGGPEYTCPGVNELVGFQSNLSADYNEDPGSGGIWWKPTSEICDISSGTHWWDYGYYDPDWWYPAYNPDGSPVRRCR